MTQTTNTTSQVTQVASALDNSMSKFFDMITAGASKASELAGKAWDVAEVQLTEVVKQFLAWEFLYSVITALACLILSFAAYRIYKRFSKGWVGDYKREQSEFSTKSAEEIPDPSYAELVTSSPFRLALLVSLCVLEFFSLNACYENSLRAVKIAVAPKVYLIEYGSCKYRQLKAPSLKCSASD